MDKKDLVYKLISLIPQGKVLTYGQITKFLGIKSARLVGQILHKNPDPKNIPCHRVVFSNGSLSKSYAFGGEKKQKEKLIKGGPKFYFDSDSNKDRILNLKKFLWQPSKLLFLYFQLLKKFSFPGPWPWFGRDRPHTKDEITIGAVLTQNTNWRNVEKAINSLRRNKLNNLTAIYQSGKKNLDKLKQLIKPSGFYNQKGERLFNFSKFIIENYQNLENFFKSSVDEARKKLLSIKGIGEETADTILLYAGEKPVFVIDAYTRRFVKKYFPNVSFRAERGISSTYNILQKYFTDNLPANVELFQDYHALIVKWGK